MAPAIQVCDLTKSFTLHVQGGVTIPVFEKLGLVVEHGECVALVRPVRGW